MSLKIEQIYKHQRDSLFSHFVLISKSDFLIEVVDNPVVELHN